MFVDALMESPDTTESPAQPEAPTPRTMRDLLTPSAHPLRVAAHPDFRLVKIDEHNTALGMVLRFLSRRTPFAATRLEMLIHTIGGSIARGHYAIIAQGEKIVGYVGWGLCDQATVDRYLKTRAVPPDRLCRAGDTMVVFDICVTERGAVDFILQSGQSAFAGKAWVGVQTRRDNRKTIRRGLFDGSTPLGARRPSETSSNKETAP